MKNIFYLTVTLFFLFSCEPRSDYDYIVINKCEEAIKVSYIASIFPSKESTVLIGANTQNLIFSIPTIESSVNINDNRVDTRFVSLIITKGQDTSQVNYLDNNLWTAEKISTNKAIFYLTVNPEDFE